MKKIVLFLISVIALLSCSDDFITKEPLGVSSNLTFYDSPENCKLAVNAVYDPLQWHEMYGINHWAIGDVCSDDAEKGGSDISKPYQEDAYDIFTMCTYNVTPLNEMIANMWDSYYIGIGRANSLLEQTENLISGKDSVLYKQYRGEARFLRAYYYFDMARIWGPVPLLTSSVTPDEATALGNRAENDNSTGTKQMEKMYEFIISELEAIQNNLPWEYSATEDFGRISKGAVQALLAKVYLYRADNEYFGEDSDYESAFTVANNLITNSNNPYELENKYQDVFDMNLENQFSDEFVFTIQYISNSNSGDSYNRNDGAEGSIKPTYTNIRWVIDPETDKPIRISDFGYGFMMPTQDLVDEFNPADPRLTMMKEEGDSIYLDLANGQKHYKVYFAPGKTTGYYCMKNTVYYDKYDATKAQNTGKSIPVIRYADVLLIAAEAGVQSGHTTEALAYVNWLRVRARKSTRQQTGYKQYDYSVPASLEPADYSAITLNKVRKERRMELFCESSRYFDVVRWGKDDEIFGSITEDVAGNPVSWNSATEGRLPIPNIQIILHTGGNLIQNPGY
ncbi:MAG: RagB/SusD family nutrient uptake outer membrane protein [Bacteroidales bacterium]|jgi:hypothetical protein|nr:RagB/SusD family nutrient uptake outer membrane protein [Bacteroidales bacterium]